MMFLAIFGLLLLHPGLRSWIWLRAGSWIHLLARVPFQTVELEDSFRGALIHFLNRYCTRTGMTHERFCAPWLWFVDSKIGGRAPFSCPFSGITSLYWYGGIPLVVRHREYVSGLQNEAFEISVIRGTLDMRDLARDMVVLVNDHSWLNNLQKKNRFQIIDIRGTGNDQDDLQSNGEREYNHLGNNELEFCYGESLLGDVTLAEVRPPRIQSLSQLEYDDHVLDAVENVRHWLDNEKWYEDRCLPYNQGWLLHGEPGTGKTSLVKALAYQFQIPVYVYHLHGLNDRSFDKAWMAMHGPCIALMEDFDTAFHGRVSQKGIKLNFGTLINCMDGVHEVRGVFTVFTANDASKIDRALCTRESACRPSRVNQVLELGTMSEAGRTRIASRMFSDDEVSIIVAEGHGDTGDQFVHRCCNRLMEIEKKRV